MSIMNIITEPINGENDSWATVNKWVNSASAGTLFAVLASTNGARGIKAWYEYDSSATPFGLYSGTPYSEWRDVMPVLVPVPRYSRFLLWVTKESVNHRGWGWLGISACSLEQIAAQFRNLVQVKMPDGKIVFFRYWDALFFSQHIHFFGDTWGNILPAFSDYWLNGETHHITTSADCVPQCLFPLNIPQSLIDGMNQLNNMPLVLNALKIIGEQYPDRILTWPEKQLTKRLGQLLTPDLAKQDNWLSIIISELDKG